MIFQNTFLCFQRKCFTVVCYFKCMHLQKKTFTAIIYSNESEVFYLILDDLVIMLYVRVQLRY